MKSDPQVGQLDDRGNAPSIGDADLSGLVERLESAEFSERQAADVQLKAVGMRAVDALAAAYGETDDFEARIRVRRIVEDIFFWDRVYGQNAFLGISHSSYEIPERGDPRIPKGKAAFRVEAVIGDTAAARAGLISQDLIVSIDGEMLAEGATAGEFAERIRRKRPGATVVLDFYRGDEPQRLEVRLGARPKEAYNSGQAAPELLQQLEAARGEFPTWWTARFGKPPFEAERESRPKYLNLPMESEEE